LALVGFAIVIGGIVVLSTAEREPEYRGKKLSEWVESGWSPGSYYFEMPDRLFEESRDAVRHIGTNALPYLLEWIRYEPPKWKNGVRGAVNWMLEKANLSKKFRDRKEIRAGGTVAVFATLGPEVRAAIPELNRISRDFHGWEGPVRAVRALGYLGRDALPPLMNMITNPPVRPARLRLEAFRSIEALGTNAVTAVPDLVKFLGDWDAPVAALTGSILFRLRTDPGLVVPAYIDALSNDKSPDVRLRAAYGIVNYGTNARPAVPALVKMLNDTNSAVREAAANALKRIDPEALEKATAQ